MPIVPPSAVVVSSRAYDAKLFDDDCLEQEHIKATHIEVCVRLRPLVIGKESSNSYWEHNANSNPAASSCSSSPDNNINNDHSSESTPTQQPKSNLVTPRSLRKPQLPRSSNSKLPTAISRRMPFLNNNNNKSTSTPAPSSSNSKATLKSPKGAVTSSNALPPENQQYAWEVVGTDTMQQAPHTDIVSGRTHMYTLDRVYDAKQSTQDVFNTSVKHLVHSALEGYHTAVLAYGQTSTGKTHTMTGTKNEPGLVPSCIQECFDYLHHSARPEENREFLFRLSYLEIYKEQIRDLLHHAKTTPPPIRLFDSAEGLVIKGLTELVVTSPKQVFQYLKQGEARRQVGCTNMNQHSSRSHVIVRLWMESKPITNSNYSQQQQQNNSSSSPNSSLSSDTQPIRGNNGNSSGNGVRVSSLSLVDLAGSESVKLSGSQERCQEGHYINKSLMTLGQVVYSLSEGAGNKHVPYRDSKLTRLLQPSLSGNAHVLLICCISPLPTHIEESHNTFKFAIRAKKIPQRATITETKAGDEKTLLQSYRQEIEELKQQLRDMKEQQQTAALLSKRSSSSNLSVVSEDVDDEIAQLAQSIQTMERLILKSHTPQQKSHSSSSPPCQPEDLLDDTVINPSNSEDADFDTDEENLLAYADYSIQPSNSFNTPPRLVRTITSTTMGSSTTNGTSVAAAAASNTATDHDLHNELKRVQGLLSSVLQKKRNGMNNSIGHMSFNDSFFNNHHSEEQVRHLQAQLEQHEVASSLRKADASFLQMQLQEKDSLLQEVSSILQAMENKQVKLEAENARLRQQLDKQTVEATSLRKQLELVTDIEKTLSDSWAHESRSILEGFETKINI